MIRNLKALGLALVAMFAMSAVAASAATAEEQGYFTSDGPVTIRGVQNPAAEPEDNALTAFGNQTICPNAIYTGHKFNVTPHTFVPPHATQMTITPHYGTCETLGLPSTVKMNGCDYVFDLGETAGEDHYDILSTVVCPQGKHIQLEVYLFSNHTFKVCTITIEHNVNGYAGLQARDTTNGKVDIEGSVEGIKATASGVSPCPNTSTNTAELHQDVIAEGRNEEGATTEIGLSKEEETTEEV